MDAATDALCYNAPMPRLPCWLVLVALLGGSPAAAETSAASKPRMTASEHRPYALTAESSLAIGFFFATHAKLAVGFSRSFLDRFELGAALRLGLGDDLLALEGVGTAGLLLHLPARIDLYLGWRVGYARFRAALPASVLWVGSLALSVLAEARYRLTTRLELRVAPLVATGYWNELWGFVLEPNLALAYRF